MNDQKPNIPPIRGFLQIIVDNTKSENAEVRHCAESVLLGLYEGSRGESQKDSNRQIILDIIKNQEQGYLIQRKELFALVLQDCLSEDRLSDCAFEAFNANLPKIIDDDCDLVLSSAYKMLIRKDFGIKGKRIKEAILDHFLSLDESAINNSICLAASIYPDSICRSDISVKAQKCVNYYRTFCPWADSEFFNRAALEITLSMSK
jgi:hypothetical protein